MRTTVNIGGIGIHDLTYEETLQEIEQVIVDRSCKRMVVTNASKTILAQKTPELLRLINESHLITADGMSVLWAARFLGQRLRQRVTGIDMMEMLVQRASEKGFSVYFLGAKPNVVESLTKHYSQKFPSLKVAGYHHGYFQKNLDSLLGEIRGKAPDILFVAMGSPAQEYWIEAHQNALEVPFCLGVGGSFDHIAGFSMRAPIWMQHLGLEWFYRLMSEPRRLWRRYLLGNTQFIWMVLRQKLSL